MYKCLSMTALLALSSGAVIAQPQQTASRSVIIVVPERTQVAAMLLNQPDKIMTSSEWKKMADGLAEVNSLKAGMTRADVLRRFHPLNNEIFSENQRRYYVADYPDLIVALEFKTSFPVSSNPHIFLNPQAYRLADHSGYFTDVLTEIKVYYAGPATEEKHTIVF